MIKPIILACCAVCIAFASFSIPNISQKFSNSLNKNGTLLKTIVLGDLSKSIKMETGSFQLKNSTRAKINKTTKAESSNSNVERHQYSSSEAEVSAHILKKIHARITRSKDAVWATVTLTSICILLVLAVAQSRMWKDHYYSESQGVPLPNFNERVLFKDVMERKVSSMKQFFKKKKSKERNETELESLLPTSD